MLKAGKIRDIGGLIISEGGWQAYQNQALNTLNAYHDRASLRLGMPRQELRSKLNLAPQMFTALIAESVEKGLMQEEGNVLRSSDHEIRFSQEQEKKIDSLLRDMKRAGVSTPSVKESQQYLGEDLYYALIDLSRLRQLNADVVYEQDQFAEIETRVIEFLRQNGEIDAAQARDLLQTSRKYAIAILEHLDNIKVTRRVGDVRVLV
jgi:selenocysteine-specific elongation factor